MENLSLDLAFEQAKRDLTQTLNHIYTNLGIPSFLLEVILQERMNEIHIQATREYQQHLQEYQRALAEAAEKAAEEQSINTEEDKEQK